MMSIRCIFNVEVQRGYDIADSHLIDEKNLLKPNV